MNVTLICATYKRPEICNRLIKSVPSNINIVVVSLSDASEILTGKNVHIAQTGQMPLTNALNLGVLVADKVFPETEAYLLTDDDVYFTNDTIIGENIFSLLGKTDTGVVAITRIINCHTPKNENICAPFVYKGGGYFIRKEVFKAIGGYTKDNSVDEWDICIKCYVAGYKNYRTKSSYAYHKQGSATGGYRKALKEGKFIGNANNGLDKYLNASVMKNSGYEYYSQSKTTLNEYAKQLHKEKNVLLNGNKADRV